MPAQFDLIVFDWDGTLLDSAAAIVHAIQRACEDLGLDMPDDRTARSVIGLGLVDALARVVPELPSSRHQELAGRYRHHYLSRDHELTLFDGVPALLDGLGMRGHTLAVATGKSRAGLDRALGHTGLGSRFAATRCADESVSKPAPDMVLELMDELSFDPARTLVIGDTTHDLLMARHAGCESVAVTYGAHPLHELLAVRPKAHCASVDELTAWLACHA
ncbi:HAD family hydrolase [Methyloversatilis sp. XJ19-49]|uniref:HAD family hydrolase n=1 Tax=Methyloversatilis sp. XJ19-49 TaxID=2963429 RepID=UPI00211C6CF5|nr:HAD-IA family hydrolase [Methyloversatilis sp. XJ19-49]MCQ9376747.1 HAD-IA family hydrolase [Methyloversatilis sp. XJ19-49]